MVLLVNGCSNSFGSETADSNQDYKTCIQYAYGAHISKIYKAEYINLAQPGSSNISIVNRTVKWINKNCIEEQNYKLTDLLVLIGWTSNGRIYINKHNFFITKGDLIHDLVNPAKSKKLKKIDPTKAFSYGLYNYVVDGEEDVTCQIYAMIVLETYFKKYNIKYFTFPTISITNIQNYPFLTKLLDAKRNFPLIKDGRPFELTTHIGRRFLTRCNHLNRLGQLKAAIWVMDQLKERNIN